MKINPTIRIASRVARWVITTVLLSAAGVLVAQTDKQVWVQRFGTTFGSKELTRSIARDSAGNAIVAGDTDEGGLGSGFLVIKYSPTGEGVWTNRYNTSDEDHVAAVAVDGSGKVFLTGSSGNGSSGYEYVTLAFSTLGIPLWTNHFNGPGGKGYTEAPGSIAVDSYGNVFVTGESHVNGRFGFATLKYSNAGVPLWTNMFVAIGDHEEGASALAVDNAGNVVVTGGVHGTGNWNDYDYVTIKYAGNGVPLWTNRCSSGGTDSRDMPSALRVDGSNNVFVTGNSGLTVKYSGAGAPLWTNFFPGAGQSLAVDADGNLVVAGGFSGRLDQPGFTIFTDGSIRTAKYSADGALLWIKEYLSGWLDLPDAAVAVDSNGDVIVTGYVDFDADQVTIKYSAAGSTLWIQRSHLAQEDDPSVHPHPAVVIDASGDALVTGYYFNEFTTDFATRKYTSNGDEAWTTYYDGRVSVSDSANAIAVDSSGNIIVTGGAEDYATIKYSPSGVALWTNYYDGPAHAWDSATALAVASSGNIFVTGRSYPGTYEDVTGFWLTIAYAGDGVALWTNACPSFEYPVAVVTAPSGDVIVSGDREVFWGEGGWATIQYSGAGVPLWTNRHSSGNYENQGFVRGLAVDGNGNVAVVGSSDKYFAAIKYSNSGSALWTNYYYGGTGDATATAVAAGANGDIFVTGFGARPGGQFDFVTIKYSAAGLPLWTNFYNGPAMLADSATALALDGSGNVLVTGYSASTNDGGDFVTINYSNDGAALWTNRYAGPSNSSDTPRRLSVDANGNVFVTGGSSSYPNSDSVTLAYSSSGIPLWTNRYYGPTGHADSATDLAVTGVGEVVVLVQSSGDYATVKYNSSFALNITSPPQNQIKNIGTTATFSVGVSGTDPFTFQWQRNGTNLLNGGNVSAATTPNLTLTAVTTNDAANYTVAVSNPAGSVTSVVAVLTVISPSTPPRLSVNGVFVSGNNLIFAWPTNFGGFTLESTTNLTPPVIWNEVTNPRVVVGAQYTVTNSRSSSAQFFRLRKP